MVTTFHSVIGASSFKFYPHIYSWALTFASLVVQNESCTQRQAWVIEMQYFSCQSNTVPNCICKISRVYFVWRVIKPAADLSSVNASVAHNCSAPFELIWLQLLAPTTVYEIHGILMYTGYILKGCNTNILRGKLSASTWDHCGGIWIILLEWDFKLANVFRGLG